MHLSQACAQAPCWIKDLSRIALWRQGTSINQYSLNINSLSANDWDINITSTVEEMQEISFAFTASLWTILKSQWAETGVTSLIAPSFLIPLSYLQPAQTLRRNRRRECLIPSLLKMMDKKNYMVPGEVIKRCLMEHLEIIWNCITLIVLSRWTF